MMKLLLPRWEESLVSGILEMEIPVGGVFLALISNAKNQKSRCIVFSLLHLESAQAQVDTFKHWVEDALADQSGSLVLRLVGNKNYFDLLEKQFNLSGITKGTHVPLDHQVVVPIQFYVDSGRIRLLKEAISRPANPSNPVKVQQERARVLVVDDSETIRKLLSKVLSSDTSIEVVGTVDTPSKVMSAIDKFKPNVITLDIHMPEMDGVTLYKQQLAQLGIPVVVITALSLEDSGYVLDALEAGVVDYIQKPKMDELAAQAPMICEKIKGAVSAKVSIKNTYPRLMLGNSSRDRSHAKLAKPFTAAEHGEIDLEHLIVIGASTGGTEALKRLLTSMPSNIPPILVVQHIPALFSKKFADRLNELCPFEVKEAEHGDLVRSNRVLIAPGGFQMGVKMSGGDIKIVIEDSDAVNRHKPSVDFLFASVCALKKSKIVAVILTGMGTDGAKEMLKLRQAGAVTFGQDENSCVVYGMPKEAFLIGAVETVLSLDDLAKAIIGSCCSKKSQKNRLG